jgi:hypothetical protein
MFFRRDCRGRPEVFRFWPFRCDCFAEFISAAVVPLLFLRRFNLSQVWAAKLCGLLLYGLAAVVTIVALPLYRTTTTTNSSTKACTG